jgi:hypothetical protein
MLMLCACRHILWRLQFNMPPGFYHPRNTMVMFPSPVTMCICRSEDANSEIPFCYFIGDLYGLDCSARLNLEFFSPLMSAHSLSLQGFGVGFHHRSSVNEGCAFLFGCALVPVNLSIATIPRISLYFGLLSQKHNISFLRLWSWSTSRGVLCIALVLYECDHATGCIFFITVFVIYTLCSDTCEWAGNGLLGMHWIIVLLAVQIVSMLSQVKTHRWKE